MTSVKIIEQISRVLQDPEGYSDATIASLADEYGKACERLNDILSEIVTYIDRGFYCEAYRLSVEEDVVSEYQTLQFNERETWREVCRMFHYELKANISDENSWKTQSLLMMYEPNKELFKQNRYLALADAPARERLDVLYRLAAITAESGEFRNNDRIWKRSIEKLEERRNDEIDRFVSELNLNNVSLAEVRGMLDELNSPMRLSTPKRQTVAKLEHVCEVLYDQERVDELSDLVDDLKDAYDAKNEYEALDGLERYRLFSDQHSAKLDKYYNELTAAQRNNLKLALEYAEKLERRDQRAEKVTRLAHELTAMLDQGAERNDVEVKLAALENAVAATGHATLPPAAERARRYLNAQSLKKARMTSTVVVAILCVIGLLVAAIVGAATVNKNNKLIAELTEELKSELDAYVAGKVEALDDALKTKTEFEEKFSKQAQRKDFVALAKRYDDLKIEEDIRVADYNKFIEAVETAHAEGRADNVSMARLKNMPKTRTEEKKVADLQTVDNGLRKKRETLTDDSFDAKVAELKKRFDELDYDKLSIDQARAELGTLERELASLEKLGRAANVAQPLMLKRDTLAKAVTKAKDSVQKNGAVDYIENAIGDAEQYRVAVERSAARYGAKVGTGFEDAMKSLADLENWNEFIDRYGADIVAGTDAKTLGKIANYLGTHQDTLGTAPEYAAVKSYCDSFADSAADGANANTAAKLLDALSMFKEPCWTIYRQAKDSYYYATTDPEGSDGVDYFTSKDGSHKPMQKEFFKMVSFEGLSVQSRLYELVAGKQDASSAAVETYAEALRLVMTAKSSEIDPGLRMALCKTIAEEAFAANLGAGVAQADRDFIASKLKGYALGSYDYYQDPNAASKEYGARQTQWENAEPVFSRVAEGLGEVNGATSPELAKYEWIGALVAGNAGMETKLSDKAKSREGTLYVTDILGSLEACGRLSDGKTTLDTTDDALTWFPLYVRVVVGK